MVKGGGFKCWLLTREEHGELLVAVEVERGEGAAGRVALRREAHLQQSLLRARQHFRQVLLLEDGIVLDVIVAYQRCP